MLKRPFCLAVCIYIAFLVGMRWVSEKDVPDLQAQNTVTILCQLDEIRGMGEKKNFVVSSVAKENSIFPNVLLKYWTLILQNHLPHFQFVFYTVHD